MGKDHPHDTATAYLQLLQKKRIIITGGTTGIGRATAVMLAAYGAKLLIFGRHETELEDAMHDIREVGGDVIGLTADQATQEGAAAVFEVADSELGGIDILINNAAVGGGSVIDQPYEEWEYVVRTNLTGYLAFAGEAYRRMEPQQSGYIVNVGSMSADSKEAGTDVYVATKGAIRAFSKSLAKKVGPSGIRVALIEPGSVGTDMNPNSPVNQRDGERHMTILMAEDIAGAIIYCLTQPLRVSIPLMQIRPRLQPV